MFDALVEAIFAKDLSWAIYKLYSRDKDTLGKWLTDHGQDPDSKKPE